MKLFLPLLIFLVFASSAFSSEIKVNVKADKLKYTEGSKIVQAEGSAEVTIENTIIKADMLLMDTRTNIVTAEGNVTMQSGDYSADCSSITYTISDETASFNDFSTQILPANASAPLYINALKLDDTNSKMSAKEGDMTTCSYKNPHYLTAAKRIEYYPNDHIEGYSVTSYLLGVPVIWSPFVYYDLKQRQRKNWTIGSNNVEGTFIKTSWDYKYGQIFLDEMEKKSFGQGLSYNYTWGNSNGSLYLYHIEEADTHLSDGVVKLNHTIGINDTTKLGIGYALSTIYQVPSGYLNQSSYSLNYSHTGSQNFNASVNATENRAGNQESLNGSLSRSDSTSSTNFMFNLNQNKVEPRNIRLSERLSHSQNLFSNSTKLNINLAYFDNITNTGAPGDQRLDPSIDLTHQTSWGNIRLHSDWRLDLDGNYYRADDNDQYLETKPEITVNLNSKDLKVFNLSGNLGYGYFHEVKYVPAILRNRDFSTGRFKATINADKSIPLPLGSNFRFNLGLDQFIYETGDAFNAFREDISLQSQGYAFFRNNMTYTRGISDGNSPFFFDKYSTKYNNLRDTMVFYFKDTFNWTNTCGYNYESNKYFNYDTNMMLKPLDQLYLNFRSGFDIENQKYLDLSSSARINISNKFNTTINAVSDLTYGGLKQGDCLFNLEFADDADWRRHFIVKYGYVYDTGLKTFVPRDIMFIKDLHCWEAKYTYSDYKKEFTLTFTLKAFPGDPVGYSTGRGFYFQGFDRAKQQIESEFNGQQTRY